MATLPSPDHVADVLLAGWSSAGRERVLQAAVDGAWEHARACPAPVVAADARALVRDAGPGGTDVAVEYEWLGDRIVFVGARREGADPAGFEAGVVAVSAEDPADPRRALALLAGGAPAELDHVELGAANAWQSVGPLRLWTRGEQPAPLDLAARLAAHPALARCHVPVALEVAFRHPRTCWLGVEVSTRSGGVHLVDATRVERLFAQLLTASGP